MTPDVHVEGLDHVVLGAADVEESVAWYRDVLGLAVERLDEWRNGTAPFPSLRVDAATVVDIVERDPVDPTDHVCLVIAVTDLHALAREIGASEPLPLFGARGQGWGVYVTDPAGNTVELRHYGATASG